MKIYSLPAAICMERERTDKNRICKKNYRKSTASAKQGYTSVKRFYKSLQKRIKNSLYNCAFQRVCEMLF
jgi:hypothetical protein